MAPRETENNAYAKFWGDKQRALWYVMVFSGVANTVTMALLFSPLRKNGYLVTATINVIDAKRQIKVKI